MAAMRASLIAAALIVVLGASESYAQKKKVAPPAATPDTSSEARLAEQREQLRELAEDTKRMEDALVAIKHELSPHVFLVSVRHQVRGQKHHDDVKTTSNYYSDGRISCLWDIYIKRAKFALSNTSDETIAIRWSGVSWIDTSNTSHRVMHDGVRFVDRSADAPDTILAPQAGIADFIVPSDAVELSNGELTTNAFISISDAAFSGQLRAMVPIVVGSEVHDYIFSFVVRADEDALAQARAEDAAKASAPPVKP